MILEILRHGETALQERHAYQGVTDAELSEEGKKKLIHIDLEVPTVYVTHLKRTKETAKILFPNAKQVETSGLEEMNFGIFEGKSYLDLENDVDYRNWVNGNCEGKCPEGESKEEFTKRIAESFIKWMEEIQKHQISRAVLVCHGGTQMAVMAQFAIPHKSYFDWHLNSGMGYILDTEQWSKHQQLKYISIRDYTKVE